MRAKKYHLFGYHSSFYQFFGIYFLGMDLVLGPGFKKWPQNTPGILEGLEVF